MRRVGVALWLPALALAVAAESAAFSWNDPARWLPDLAVALVLLACAHVAASRGARPVAALLAAAGVAWLLGNFAEELLYLHRGPLVHLLLTYPSARPRSRLELVGVVAGYAACLVAPVWRSETATVGLAVAFAIVLVYAYVTSPGRARPGRATAVASGLVLAVVLVAGSIARGAVPSGDAVEPALLAYEAAVAGVAIALVAALRAPAAATVADLVVELGEVRSTGLRDALARALGDPTLQVGYWSASSAAFVEEGGAELRLPPPGSNRSATPVERDGSPYAVLVHDAAVLADPALVEAVSAATRLAASNRALQGEVRAQVAELTASRRRLVAAADESRRGLEAQLRAGPERRLASLADLLDALAHGPGAAGPDVERARRQLARLREELAELSHGLHPRALVEGGLEAALRSLAEHAPVPVALDVRVGRLPAELEATAYFVCAEALANVAKHAGASRVELAALERPTTLSVVVADDGVGGADASHGSGLQGLADRVAVVGGSLHVESAPGGGTRLVAELPLDDEARR